MLLNTLQHFDINPVDFFLLLGTVGLALFFVLAALATPLLGVATESVYAAKRKAFYDKCALQITQAAFGMGMVIFLVLAAGAAYYTTMFALPSLSLPRGELENPGLLLLAWETLGPMTFFLPPLAALCLLMLYLGSWSALKQARGVHLIIGWLCALGMLLVLFFGLLILANAHIPLLFSFLLNNPLPVLEALCRDFFSGSALPLGFLCLLSAGMAAGAGLSQLWLIMRRAKADYGRDYYAFAMRYCARAALAGTLALLAFGALLYWLLRHSVPPGLNQPLDIGILVIALGLPLSCCLLWLSIARSETPLRHKPGAFFACVFLCIALCAQLLMLVNAFPMA